MTCTQIGYSAQSLGVDSVNLVFRVRVFVSAAVQIENACLDKGNLIRPVRLLNILRVQSNFPRGHSSGGYAGSITTTTVPSTVRIFVMSETKFPKKFLADCSTSTRNRTHHHETAAPDNQLPQPSSICLTVACHRPESSSEATQQTEISRNGTWESVGYNPTTTRMANIVRQIAVLPALHYHVKPGIAPRGWWKRLGTDVPEGRVLITAEEYERVDRATRRKYT